jgi:quercetin dioxygenase-like cupin family protein
MSDEVRIGLLRLKFLIDDADNGGKVAMFEMTVPEPAKVPAAHYHRDFEEIWYGLGGTLTVTVDGVAHRLQSGDALFVPRGAVHRFDNLDTGDARALITLTPAVAGKKYFEEIGAVVNAGGPPDMAKVKAVMEKYGLIVA